MKWLGTLVVMAVLAGGGFGWAGEPVQPSLCVQGYLYDEVQQKPVNDDVDILVCLYDAATGGTCVGGPWPVTVHVRAGLFALVFGQDTPALNPALFGQQLWAEFTTTPGGPMTPRVALRTVPYAFRVGYVGTPELGDSVVTTPKLADNAVTSAKLADSIELGSNTPGNPGRLGLFNGLGAPIIDVSCDYNDGAAVTARNSTGLPTLIAFSEGGSGSSGAFLALHNGNSGPKGNQVTIAMDADRAGLGDGALAVRNGEGRVAAQVYVDRSGAGKGGYMELSSGTSDEPSKDIRMTLRADGQSAGSSLHMWNGGNGDPNNNQETVTLDGGAGRIGIAASSPQARVDIGGTPGVDGIRFPDGSMQTTAYSGPLVGEVRMWAGLEARIPLGWMLCDGREVSRTQYARLFTEIGTSWGAGNGTSTFNLPDLRGRFARGVDGTAGRDPDSGARTACNLGGNAGNDIGSVQGHAFQGHYHVFRGNHIPYSGGGGSDFYAPESGAEPTTTVDRPNIAEAKTDGTSGSPATSRETRPINAYVYYIIRVGG